MSKIYVLGSSGFIGTALVKKLAEHNESFLTVGRENSDIHLELGECHQNLTNAAQGGDVVIFLSAISSPEICNNQRELAERINVTTTIDLIRKLLLKDVRVVFSSTDVVFGCSVGISDDNSEAFPFGVYGEMKARVENEFSDNKFFKSVRFSYVMGPNDKYTNMLMDLANSNKPLEVFEGFERNVVALSDVTDGLLLLTQNWNYVHENRINFAGPQCVSRWFLTKAFSERFCHNLKFSLVDAPEGFWDSRPKRIEMTSSVFPRLLGRRPKTINENLDNWCE